RGSVPSFRSKNGSSTNRIGCFLAKRDRNCCGRCQTNPQRRWLKTTMPYLSVLLVSSIEMRGGDFVAVSPCPPVTSLAAPAAGSVRRLSAAETAPLLPFPLPFPFL